MPYDEMLSWLLFYTGILDLQRLPQMEIPDPVGLVQSQALISAEPVAARGAERLVGDAHAVEPLHLGVLRFRRAAHRVLCATISSLPWPRCAARGANFLRIPDNYYDDVEAKYGLDAELMAALRDNQILYDREGDGEFFQIYTPSFDERFFFEIVERRNYQGFGAANAGIRLAAQTRDARPVSVPRV